MFIYSKIVVQVAYFKNKVQNLYNCGALKGTRTPDLLVRSQSLYPAELSAHFRAVIFDCPYIITHLFEKINP